MWHHGSARVPVDAAFSCLLPSFNSELEELPYPPHLAQDGAVPTGFPFCLGQGESTSAVGLWQWRRVLTHIAFR